MSEHFIQPCPYGQMCYRKNPQHFAEYSHKHSTNSEQTAVAMYTPKRQGGIAPYGSESSPKKLRNGASSSSAQTSGASLSASAQTSSASLSAFSEVATREPQAMSPAQQVCLNEKSSKYRYYMTYVHRGIDNSYNQGSALTLHNVINGTKGQLLDSCLFSYMYDLNWIKQQFKPADRDKPMTIVEGLQGSSRIELSEQGDSYPNIRIIQAKFEILYGVHHTKMAILRYDTGIRIMITTANLIPLDWFQKSQAMWCSPLCPLGDADSVTNFKADLIEYIKAYKSPMLNEWADVLKLYDMSKCMVYLIASVPGRHKDEQRSSFGHLKLRKILQKHGPATSTASTWSVIGQFSSIGRLGANATNWLTGEFLISMATCKGSTARNKPPLKLIYPTTDDVRNSLEGYQAGGSLPFNQQTYDSQRYIKSHMHKWRSECRGRTLASPHIKTYLRLSPDNKKIPWFLMTSSNLSKAAWGMLEKQDSQLMIRSYELGVLFLPKMFDLDTFIYDSTFAHPKAFPVPFDLPLTSYEPEDEPWIVNKSYPDQPDNLGILWRPA